MQWIVLVIAFQELIVLMQVLIVLGALLVKADVLLLNLPILLLQVSKHPVRYILKLLVRFLHSQLK